MIAVDASVWIDVLPALGLTATQAAKQLDVSSMALSRALNGRSTISLETALRMGSLPDLRRTRSVRLFAKVEQASLHGHSPFSYGQGRSCLFTRQRAGR